MTPLLAILVGAQTFDLRPRPSSQAIVFNVTEERTEGGARQTLGTRFEVVGRGPGSIELSTGPFSSGGRTFGRKKTRSIALTPLATVANDAMGRPPFLLSVPLPGRPVKVGDAWTGAIVGPTPMPAGVKGTFKVLGPSKVGGVPCVRIGAKIDAEQGGAKITGRGEWAVRLDDGLVQSGSLNALLVYRRPDQATHKIVESARVNVKASISRA